MRQHDKLKRSNETFFLKADSKWNEEFNLTGQLLVNFDLDFQEQHERKEFDS